jgi:hypothetical protein
MSLVDLCRPSGTPESLLIPLPTAYAAGLNNSAPGGAGASLFQIPCRSKQIATRKNHHCKIGFKDEYRMLLKKLNIEFDLKIIQ